MSAHQPMVIEQLSKVPMCSKCKVWNPVGECPIPDPETAECDECGLEIRATGLEEAKWPFFGWLHAETGSPVCAIRIAHPKLASVISELPVPSTDTYEVRPPEDDLHDWVLVVSDLSGISGTPGDAIQYWNCRRCTTSYPPDGEPCVPR